MTERDEENEGKERIGEICTNPGVVTLFILNTGYWSLET